MVQLICCNQVAKKNIIKYFMGNMNKYFVKFIRPLFFVSNTLDICSVIHVEVIKTSVHRILN